MKRRISTSLPALTHSHANTHGSPVAAFTLVELLLVVAVVALLAAIAVPNFLEANIRSKVSRAKSDLRVLSTALESYHVDNNSYVDFFTPLTRLTSPVAYVPTLTEDVFQKPRPSQGGGPFGDLQYFNRVYGYGAMPLDNPSRYVLSSVGPDTDIDTYMNGAVEPLALKFYPGYSFELVSEAGVGVNSANFRYDRYDPSNGTVSSGDVFRFGERSTF